MIKKSAKEILNEKRGGMMGERDRDDENEVKVQLHLFAKRFKIFKKIKDQIINFVCFLILFLFQQK